MNLKRIRHKRDLDRSTYISSMEKLIDTVKEEMTSWKCLK